MKPRFNRHLYIGFALACTSEQSSVRQVASPPAPEPAAARNAMTLPAAQGAAALAASPAVDAAARYRPPDTPGAHADREKYAAYVDNPLQRVRERPLSTFSIDVDTGAYANARRFITQGRLPPHDAIRAEAFINEARKVLSQELSATLMTIASDVKI